MAGIITNAASRQHRRHFKFNNALDYMCEVSVGHKQAKMRHVIRRWTCSHDRMNAGKTSAILVYHEICIRWPKKKTAVIVPEQCMIKLLEALKVNAGIFLRGKKKRGSVLKSWKRHVTGWFFLVGARKKLFLYDMARGVHQILAGLSS